MANDRQVAILGLLKDGPKRGVDLCRGYLELNRAEAEDDDRFFEYVPTLLSGLEGKGWVQRVKSYGNNVWYVLTEEGFSELLRSSNPEKLRRMRRSRLRRALISTAEIEGRRIDWRDQSNYTTGMRERLEDSRRRTEEIARLLPSKDVDNVKMLVLADLMAENRKPNRRTEGRTRAIEGYASELPSAMVVKADAIAGRKLRNYHEKEGIRVDGDGNPMVYGKCFFCGADIVVKEAAEDARLLTTYGGKKGEMVCCSCYANMKWMEKHFGGEQIGKSIQA